MVWRRLDPVQELSMLFEPKLQLSVYEICNILPKANIQTLIYI